MSTLSTFFSCAIEMTRGVSSSLASSSTSPVPGSTMSAAAKAPSRASSVIVDGVDAGLAQRRRWRLADLLALGHRDVGAGILMSFVARRPTMLSLTAQRSVVPARCSRSTP